MQNVHQRKYIYRAINAMDNFQMKKKIHEI